LFCPPFQDKHQRELSGHVVSNRPIIGMSHGVAQSRCRRLPVPMSLPLAPTSTTRRRSSAASPSLHTGSSRSPEVTSSATEEPNGGDENEDGQAPDDFEEKAFFVLDKTTRPRSWCITVVLWPYPFSTLQLP